MSPTLMTVSMLRIPRSMLKMVLQMNCFGTVFTENNQFINLYIGFLKRCTENFLKCHFFSIFFHKKVKNLGNQLRYWSGFSDKGSPTHRLLLLLGCIISCHKTSEQRQNK